MNISLAKKNKKYHFQINSFFKSFHINTDKYTHVPLEVNVAWKLFQCAWAEKEEYVSVNESLPLKHFFIKKHI